MWNLRHEDIKQSIDDLEVNWHDELHLLVVTGAFVGDSGSENRKLPLLLQDSDVFKCGNWFSTGDIVCACCLLYETCPGAARPHASAPFLIVRST